MSEDSVKINGAVQVVKFFIFGLVYITLLYFVATAMETQLLNNSAITDLANGVANNLKDHAPNAAIAISIAGMVFLSTVTGILLNDLVKKFSIISLLLFVVASAVDLVPIKLIAQGHGII